MPTKNFMRIMSILTIGVLTACSSGGTMKITSSTTPVGLAPNPSVRLVVTPQATDAEDVLADVKSAVLSQLLATGHYSKVVMDSEPTDLIINININKYAKVSVGERLLVGALAGRNRVGTQVRITQASNNAVIKEFVAEGESAAHPLSSESGIGDAIREVAKQVASGAVI